MSIHEYALFDWKSLLDLFSFLLNWTICSSTYKIKKNKKKKRNNFNRKTGFSLSWSFFIHFIQRRREIKKKINKFKDQNPMWFMISPLKKIIKNIIRIQFDIFKFFWQNSFRFIKKSSIGSLNNIIYKPAAVRSYSYTYSFWYVTEL